MQVRPQVLISVSIDREAGCVTFSSQTATLGMEHRMLLCRHMVDDAQHSGWRPMLWQAGGPTLEALRTVQ